MSEIVAVITQIAILVFVVTSMLAMGLSLTIPQIVQPLKNARLVIFALLANFVPLSSTLKMPMFGAMNLSGSIMRCAGL